MPSCIAVPTNSKQCTSPPSITSAGERLTSKPTGTLDTAVIHPPHRRCCCQFHGCLGRSTTRHGCRPSEFHHGGVCGYAPMTNSSHKALSGVALEQGIETRHPDGQSLVARVAVLPVAAIAHRRRWVKVFNAHGNDGPRAAACVR